MQLSATNRLIPKAAMPDRPCPESPGQLTGSHGLGVSVAHRMVELFRAWGVRHLFGVPGDYSFPLLDAVIESGRLEWVGACNELNAGYMADGAARVTGLSVLSTTWGVGELSTLNAMAGAYAERVPIVHIVGMPSSPALQSSMLIHHTMREGDPLATFRMSASAACDAAVLSVDNAASESARLIRRAQAESRPVVIGLPMDVARTVVADHGWVDESLRSASPPGHGHIDPLSTDEAVAAIGARLSQSTRACVLVGALVVRLGLRRQALQLIERLDIPFATMWMDKSALDEGHPLYCGMYHGRLAEEAVREFVESCDTVVNLGALWSDVNTGAFTAAVTRSKCINVDATSVRVGSARFDHVPMAVLLDRLCALPPCPRTGDATMPRPSRAADTTMPPCPAGLGQPRGTGTDPIEPDAFFPRCQQFIRAGDLCVVETGTISMGLAPARMANGADFVNQALWGSIGWATPAAIGAAIDCPERRVVLFTGEGALQCTAQELGTVSRAGRSGANLIVIVVNNDGYLTERLLSANTEMPYNDLAAWRYTALPGALGADGWFTARATTCAELDAAMAVVSTRGGPALIEVVMPGRSLPPIGHSLRRAVESLYQKPK